MEMMILKIQLNDQFQSEISSNILDVSSSSNVIRNYKKNNNLIQFLIIYFVIILNLF